MIVLTACAAVNHKVMCWRMFRKQMKKRSSDFIKFDFIPRLIKDVGPVFCCFTRGDAADPRGPLVVSGWAALGLHDHQRHAGAKNGSAVFHRHTLSYQPGLSLPKGTPAVITCAQFCRCSEWIYSFNEQKSLKQQQKYKIGC